MTDTAWFLFSPVLAKRPQIWKIVLSFAQDLTHLSSLDDPIERTQTLRRLRFELLKTSNGLAEKDRALLSGVTSLLTDLVNHGWSLLMAGSEMRVARPAISKHQNPTMEKERIRKQLHTAREYQIQAPATRDFISSMEKRHFYKGAFVSVFSLMRDGVELSKTLRNLSQQSVTGSVPSKLSKAIKPYLVFVEQAALCE